MSCDVFNPNPEGFESNVFQYPFGDGLLCVAGAGIDTWGVECMGGQGNAPKPRPKIQGSQERNRRVKDNGRRHQPPKPRPQGGA